MLTEQLGSSSKGNLDQLQNRSSWTRSSRGGYKRTCRHFKRDFENRSLYSLIKANHIRWWSWWTEACLDSKTLWSSAQISSNRKTECIDIWTLWSCSVKITKMARCNYMLERHSVILNLYWKWAQKWKRYILSSVSSNDSFWSCRHRRITRAYSASCSGT